MRTALTTITLCALLLGCDSEMGANERRAILRDDIPLALRTVRQDRERTQSGVAQAAETLARGFLVPDPAQREREMRSVMRRIQQPPRGIDELMVSPISFLAAVDANGRVIARDSEPDPMRNFDLGAAAPIVRQALEGRAGYALSQLPSLNEDEAPSVTVLFASPARHDGRVVGAVVAGLPLWRLTQQLSRQLQLENAPLLQRGHLLWAIVYAADELHYHAGFPPDLRELVPDRAARQRGLARSAGGYTGEIQQYGRWYGYAVVPLPTLGEDVGVVLFRSDPI